MSSLLAHSYLERERLPGPELHVLLLLSGTGGVIMAFANDLIIFFLGLETLSMAVYVLAAMHRRKFESAEAGMKYFVLGAFSSTFLLYGIALVYGATGTTNLVQIRELLETTIILDDGLLLGGLGLMIVGLAFKVGAVPFHAWTPDVYEGAPTPVVAFMASGVKAAGFAGLLRIMSVTFAPLVDDWGPPLEVIAALTLLVGAVSAIVQTNVKRMLAYSSISHAGFILLGVIAASDRGTSAALFYLASYAFLVIGTFGVLTVMGGEGDNDFSLDNFKGLARRKPLFAFAMLIFLLAQAGVPLTTGFFAKFNVIAAAVDSERYWVSAVAMVAAVISAFLYIKVIVAMSRCSWSTTMTVSNASSWSCLARSALSSASPRSSRSSSALFRAPSMISPPTRSPNSHSDDNGNASRSWGVSTLSKLLRPVERVSLSTDSHFDEDALSGAFFG